MPSFTLPNGRIIEVCNLEADFGLVDWHYANDGLMHHSKQIDYCSPNARFKAGQYVVYLKELVPAMGYNAKKFL